MDSDEEEVEELSGVEEGEASGAEEETEELSGTEEEAEEPSEEGLAAGFPPQAARLNISTAARRRANAFFIGLSDPFFLTAFFGRPAEQLFYTAGLLRCLPRDSLIHYTACSGGGQDGGRRVGPAP